MAKQKAQHILAAVVVVVVLALALLSYSLWTHDYKAEVRLPTSVAPHRVTPSLSVRPALPNEVGVFAEFSLKNDGRSRVRLLDTAALEPLYAVQLQVRAPDGGLQPAGVVPHLMTIALDPATHKMFDPERDGIVELVPGSALIRHINLATLFDVKAAGSYRLAVTYQPEVLGSQMGEDYEPLDVHKKRLASVLEFELPLKKAMPREAAPEEAVTPPKP